MNIQFKKDAWTMDGLTYAGSARFPAMPEMEQKEDHLANVTSDLAKDGYAYVSLVTKEKVQPGVKITSHCAFEELAAPLFVMPRQMEEKDGYLFYSDCLEVVLWTNGVNVWKLWKDETGELKVLNLMRLKKHFDTGVIYDVSVEIQKERFAISVDDFHVELHCNEIYDQFHLGITACEGPCQFYDMQIENC